MALPASTLVEAYVTPAELGVALHSKRVAKARDAHELSEEIRRGLPAEVLHGLRELGYTTDEIARVTANSERTIHRYLVERRKSDLLNLATSDRAVRLAAVSVLAERLIGDRETALKWLRSRSRYLGNLTPLEMLETEVGTQAVVQSMYSVAYGGVA